MAEVPSSVPLLPSNQWARGIYLCFCCSNLVLIVAFCFSTAYTNNGSSQEYLPKSFGQNWRKSVHSRVRGLFNLFECLILGIPSEIAEKDANKLKLPWYFPGRWKSASQISLDVNQQSILNKSSKEVNIYFGLFYGTIWGPLKSPQACDREFHEIMLLISIFCADLNVH